MHGFNISTSRDSESWCALSVDNKSGKALDGKELGHTTSVDRGRRLCEVLHCSFIVRTLSHQSLNTGVMPFSPSLHPTPPIAQQMTLADPLNRPTHHYSHGLDTPLLSSTEINFTTQSLESARIVGQVDNKFIACLFDTGATGRTLVLIDQHAADERVAVEEILRGLCDGFVANSIRQTEVSDLMVVLTRVEARQLSQPGAIAVFGRWGISLESPEYRDEVDYVQIPVKAVPTVLASRLARKEASEITRLIRLYLDQLSEDLQEIRAAIFRFDQVQESEVGDWQIVQRWMPQEMLELVNSKACRSGSSE